MYGTENILGYLVERKKVKNINLKIRQDGTVYISAPLNIDKAYIEAFILSKKAWIDSHIKRIENIKKINQNLNTFEDKSYIFILGKKYILNINKSNDKNIKLLENEIILDIDDISPNNVKTYIYNNLLFKIANNTIKKRFLYYQNLMGENKEIDMSIGHMKSKWGLCIPAKRVIKFSIELIKRPVIEIDSVIVHELAHLKHSNHNKDFYMHIEKYFKDYKIIDKRLRNIY